MTRYGVAVIEHAEVGDIYYVLVADVTGALGLKEEPLLGVFGSWASRRSLMAMRLVEDDVAWRLIDDAHTAGWTGSSRSCSDHLAWHRRAGPAEPGCSPLWDRSADLYSRRPAGSSDKLS
jgi:hypothetical protein